jgi:hypothetical protein
MTSSDQTAPALTAPALTAPALTIPAVVTRPRAHPADAPERHRRALAALAQMYAYFGTDRA